MKKPSSEYLFKKIFPLAVVAHRDGSGKWTVFTTPAARVPYVTCSRLSEVWVKAQLRRTRRIKKEDFFIDK